VSGLPAALSRPLCPRGEQEKCGSWRVAGINGGRDLCSQRAELPVSANRDWCRDVIAKRCGREPRGTAREQLVSTNTRNDADKSIVSGNSPSVRRALDTPD